VNEPSVAAQANDARAVAPKPARPSRAWRAYRPDLYPRRGLAAWRFYVFVMATLVLFWLGLGELEITAERVLRGLGKLGEVFGLMVPPEPKGRTLEYLGAIAETVAMAFFGTLLASSLALPLALLGARNVMPLGPVRFFVRRSSDIVRGLDSLIWAIFFVSVVGLGPFAGILAIAVNDTGVLTKLYAEALENTDPEQAKGVRATGAGRLQTLLFGVLPQVLPVFLANSLYFLESNVRSATILGVVGAGGIGFYLMDRMMINAWREVSVIILLVLVTVAAIDTLSRLLRQHLIGQTVVSRS
jgi:phosphonate transport system permease protein